ECPDLEDVGLAIFKWEPPAPPFVTLKYKGQEILDAQFFGYSPNSFKITNSELADGRLFNEVDNFHRRDVTVLGAEVVKRFFPNEDAVGKTIVADGHSFTVIGTLARRKEFLGDTTTDRRAFVPYLTFKKYYPSVKDNFVSGFAGRGRMDQALDEVKATLRRRRHVKPADPDSFSVSTADTVVQQFNQIISTVA